MVIVAPATETVQRLGALPADGTLRVPLQGTHELGQAPTGAAHAGKLAIEARGC